MYRILLSILAFTFCLTANAQSASEAQALHDKGKQCVNEGKIAEGRSYTKKALDMRKQLFGEVNEDYITSLNNYALSFALENDNATAVKYQERTMALCDKLKAKLGKPHKNYGLYALNMGRFYYLSNNIDGAVKYWELALPSVEKYSKMYESLLEWLAMIYSDRNDKENLKRLMTLTEDHNQHELKKECNEPKCMLTRANYYATKGNSVKAKECFLRMLSMKMDDSLKAEAYQAYAKFLANANDMAAAGEYGTQSAKLILKTQGMNKTYASQLYMAALYYHIGKQYQQAIDNFNEVIDFYKSQTLTESNNGDSQQNSALKKIAECNKGIGNALSALNKFDMAVKAYKEAVAYYEQYEPDSEEYPKAVLRLAKAEKFNKEYDSSIEHHKAAMRLFETKGMSQEYTDAASSLKLCYFYAGRAEDVEYNDEEMLKARNRKLDNIIIDEKANLQMTRQYLGKLTYARSLATIAGCYAMKEDYADAVAYYQQYVEAVRDAIRDEFRMQSEKERMLTWQEEQQNIKEMLDLLIMIPAANASLQADFAAVAYDAELLAKGILLNSAIEFEKLLQQKGDRKMKALYEETKENETQIQHLRKNAGSDDDMAKILKLTQKNQALLLQLYKGCSEFADFTNYISYDWKDVQQKLSPKDVAVEFAVVGTSAFDDENVIKALVLTSEMSQPTALTVCTLAEAKSMQNNESLFDSANSTVWNKLKPYLNGKQRLFFSADGVFNLIAIEYLSYEGKPLSEQMEVYRLSTTKELCYSHKKVATTNAILFGDINYNEDATMSRSTKQAISAMRSNGQHGEFADLANTKKEVVEIEQILKSGKIKSVKPLMDREASKKAFLRLSDTKINILHVATHGAYITDKKNTSDTEAMSHSMLAFAGANLDSTGVVTAAEVAKMNLRECDLVALSACETGLGKMGADGVIGLQRGFKNAGVHTLLMSLKNVYDNSTAELMICFYRNLMAGESKRKALIKAQQELRSKGYAEAKHWATFILLDAF